ncbi:MAG: serine hydrolase [Saprospiraceae bacterium]|jgi:CubicO group peptidase (beta-lactamase class C family)|nr:serine hydrolase [Saprospiraceae bacterium]MBP6566518.1 serine hydrolase [Saprospiraceae bacterium]
MIPFQYKIAFIFFLFTTILPLNAQEQKGEIKMGKTIYGEIVSGQKHQYTLKLKKDQNARLTLIQVGVDVKIITYDPSKNKLEEFDSPNGNNGPENVVIQSTNAGDYILEISPLEEDAPKGKYELSILKIKPKATTPNEQVDDIFYDWDKKITPGAAVAVVKGGKIIFKKGYGMAHLEYDIPIIPSTVFHIASVSKQFTVFAALLLVKQGKLSLDDDIRKYIPEVPDFGKTITLRHLATHTSGLRDQWNLLAMAGWRLDDVITKEHILKIVSRQKELNFNPGEEYVYCNTGFTLLAEAVARVSGMSFAEFTQKNIFEPIQMKSTLFYDDHEKIVKNRAYSYYQDSTGYKKSVLSYANAGATSLLTTVEDLSLWAMNFSALKVGDTSIISKMNTLATLNNGKTFGGALGQFVGTYKGLNEISHGGADAGYRTFLTRFPDEDVSVIVFSNDGAFNSGGIAHKVADIFLKDKIKEEPKKEEPKSGLKPEDIILDQKTLDSYLGDFELVPGFVINILSENGKLFGQATGQPRFTLLPAAVHEFTIKEVSAKVVFVPSEDGKVNLLKLHQGGNIMDAKRMQAFDKTKVNLSDFEGHFYSDELATGYHFKINGDKLTATHSRLSDFELSPVKKDYFNGAAWFFGQVEFVRDAEGKINGCKVTNGRVRNLYFRKM